MSLLSLEGVGKRYGAPDAPDAIEVLRDVTFTMAAGDALAVIGPSGSGKSTLLNLIGALDRPSAGAIRLAGRELSQLPDEALAAIRARAIGFVFQQHHLLPQCTVLENVLVPSLAFRQTPAERDATARRAEALLERVGLTPRRHHRPGRLSGGEAQRAAVVRSLINRPQLLLADEPTGSLDARSAAALGDLLLELNRTENVALLVVTHSRELAQRMQRVLTLDNGHLHA